MDDFPFEVYVPVGNIFWGKEDNYSVIKKIGEGTYGMVFKAKDSNGNYVAIKRFNKKSDAERELAAFRLLGKNPWVVDLIDSNDPDHTPFIAMELMDGDISFKEFELSECVTIMQMLTEGLFHMHEHGVLHLDIKPGNILMRKEGGLVVKYTDFGLFCNAETQEICIPAGTDGFADKEIIRESKKELFLDHEVWKAYDVFALGRTFYWLLAWRHDNSFRREYKKNNFPYVFKNKIGDDRETFRKLRELILRMLEHYKVRVSSYELVELFGDL